MRGLSRTTKVLIAVGVACSILILLNMLELRNIREPGPAPQKLKATKAKQPKFVVYTKDGRTGHLKHVFNVMRRLGYEESTVEDNWDVLWSHPYPFTILPALKHLKPHQKVNHFPGSGFITNKANLATMDIPHVPKAFRLPKDRELLFDYVKRNPKKVFVQKSNHHRGIKISNVKELDLSANGTFVQEYVDRPLLVDGYKFDIGVYTILTSVDPLRVYIYGGDVLFRFCPEKYHPFDPKVVDKYVIGDDYLPTWKVPSLKKYFTDGGFSMKDSFDAYMREIGKEPEKVWKSVEAAIQEVYLQTELSIVNLLSQYKTKQTYFEMVRFDFVIDEDLNVFIMEANMSPNLSSQHFPPNSILYEQVLFNLLSLVGVGQQVHKESLIRTKEEMIMQVNSKQLGVYPEICGTRCDTCMAPECQICQGCLTEEMHRTLQAAYLEHVNRHECRRVFPPPMTQKEAAKHFVSDSYSPENQLMYRWFKGKCLLDKAWCE
ncbi:probable tubulin polyglutamylase ttll-15 isoform X3 [Thrips palmi]|nr:probable tubulin polyglutamylase ttll-15 isoform X3 [Thrips palmi]XP_034238967.1 probable tubulin polyglutamylase ttll-15 isoform X3 [Thrips palmi]XP_034238968.1 probable tubulin polyglutamylase ttll-15 isoform X3 [Thrips palmi]XP_034238969.1 probable tubulin polyglutamylase ttll-15 isoform X3 [Thrips palmi]